MNNVQLARAIQKLINNQQQATHNQHSLNTIDLYPSFKHLFNRDAIEILKTQSYGMIHVYNEIIDERAHAHDLIDLLSLLKIESATPNPCYSFFVRKVACVKCFGICCNNNQIVHSIHKMISAINDMASNKQFIASLSNLGMIELFSEDPNNKKFVVFSYIAIREEHQDDVNKNYGYLQFKEGGMPQEFA